MKAIVFNGYRILLKPSLLLIIGGTLFGIASVAVLAFYPKAVNRPPAYGYLAPTTWKFEHRSPAQVKISAVSTFNTYGGFDTKKDSDSSAYRLDMDNGVLVDVKQIGPTPDYIYLRNGLGLEQLQANQSATLTFEAKSAEEWPVLCTIRDNKTLLWSKQIKVSGDWKSYSLPLQASDIRQANKLNVIFALQLGARRGAISLRQVALR